MQLKKYKPITPGTRFKINLINKNLSKTKIEKYLIKKINKKGGRNNQGKITIKSRGGGHKRRYRLILFKRVSTTALVSSIEYDPNRTSDIAKIFCNDLKQFRYILAPEGLEVGAKIVINKEIASSLNIGDSTILRNIPVGSLVHNIELKPNSGGKLVRSAGAFAQLVEKIGDRFAKVRLRSGELRLISLDCFASLGIIGNSLKKSIKKGKAGKNRWLGFRPKVRGVAMNPVDHPHGGGEGKTSGGRPSVTPKGRPTKGQPTRKKPLSKNIVLSCRKLKILKSRSTRKGKFSY